MTGRRGLAVLGREGPVLGLILTIAVLAVAYLTVGGVLLGQDSATQFYPWYGFLGEQLRQGRIPEWNPAQFSGAPFAADPQAGWGYFLAMVIFTALPLVAAVVVFLLTHLVLAMTGAYLLARLVGCSPLGAAVAAAGYAGTGVFLGRSPCCPASYELVTWVPIALVGVDLVVRSTTPRGWLGGVSIAGLAISQALAAWIGQGAYYLLIVTGLFFVYRVLIDPPTQRAWGRDGRQRALFLVGGGGAILAAGFGLAAMSVLPRLEFNAVSNVAGGVYSGSGAVEAVVGGSSKEGAIDRFLLPSLYYPGIAAVTLATIGVLVAARRRASRFWLGLAVAAMVLTLPDTTPLHGLLYLLPRMESLHRHYPERVILVAFVGMAMLAGSAASPIRGLSRATRFTSAAVPLGLLGILAIAGTAVPVVAIVTVALASGLWLAVQGSPGMRATAATVCLVVLVAIDGGLALHRLTDSGAPFGGFHRVQIGDDYEPAAAARTLLDWQRDAAPFRYAGYDPSLVTIEDGQTVLYRYQFADPLTRELVVNNRATLLGLEDSQGYNPIQIGRYAAYVAAMNGEPQEYHGADVYPGGLGSPLLDLLNVRYLVTPAWVGAAAGDPFAAAGWPTVADLGTVRIVENPGAMPRAWVVHEAMVVPAADQPTMLAAGSVDPARVALVEDHVPGLPGGGLDATADVTTVVGNDDPDRISVRTETAAPGLLVLSEVAYPAWEATVDGEPTPIVTANGLFRAVPIPAGEHVVELRYRSAAMGWGLAITIATALALLAGLVATALGRWGIRRRWRKAPDSSRGPIDRVPAP
ncbi:MAG: YfhO family protein [Chloroflexia bacterium]|nr:YfhO family protein [Chloroflexia bacterium]